MPHPRNPGWINGDHWVVCDVCGWEYRQSIMKKRWDGLVVCPDDWEIRHPQDFVRGVPDDSSAKGFVRPPPEDTFNTAECSFSARQGVAGVGVAGCAIAGNTGDIPEGTFGD